MENLRSKQPVVSWYKAVWFSMAIHRHAFVLWLVFINAIVTNEKMCSWGYGGDTLCRFCFGIQGSVEHLFFQCSFSMRIWRSLMADCLVVDSVVEWADVVHWSARALKGKKP